MSEYDDLFKKYDEKVEIASQVQETPLPDPDESMTKHVNQSKINFWILVTYIIVSFLASFLSGVYYGWKYPNADALIENISVQPAFSLFNSSETFGEPYGVRISGFVQNQNTVGLPNMWVEFSLYGADETLIDTIRIDQDDVPVGGILVLDFEGAYSTEIYSYSVSNYGFDESDMFYILLNFSTVFICSVIFLILDRLDFKRDAKAFFKNPWAHLGKIVGGYLIVYFALIVSQILLSLLGASDTSQNENTIAGMFSADPLALILLFFLLCVLTPITEELVFRKVIYGFFDRKFGVVVAVFVSGAIFGLMHVVSFGDYIQAIPYVFMGGAFGFIYHWANKNIFVTMGVHFINNFISFMIYFLMVYGISIL